MSSTVNSVPPKKMVPTAEQASVIRCHDQQMNVHAFAGTGKTSTLLAYTQAYERERFLYCVYNTANKKEAEQKFGPNTTVKTSHGLAYGSFGYLFQRAGKLNAIGEKPIDVAKLYECNFGTAKTAMDLVARYSNLPVNDFEDPLMQLTKAETGIVDIAVRLWNDMVDLDNEKIMLNPRLARKRKVQATHDVYLKQFVMSGQAIRGYEVIMMDEAQDMNPLMLHMLEQNRKIRQICVGDKHQSIYGFRGAVNALDKLKGTRFDLTSSFRFGSNLAYCANSVLDEIGETRMIKGLAPQTALANTMDATKSRYTYLSRTNAGAVNYAFDTQGPVHFIGGLEAYRIDRILDAYSIYSNRPERVTDNEFKNFKRFKDLVEYADATGDVEVAMIVHMVREKGHSLPDLVEDLRRRQMPEDLASLVIATAHKSKGLEWDRVMLGDFFEWADYVEARDISIKNGKPLPSDWVQELNLLYVATTRAKTEFCPSRINKILIQQYRARLAQESPKPSGVSTPSPVAA